MGAHNRLTGSVHSHSRVTCQEFIRSFSRREFWSCAVEWSLIDLKYAGNGTSTLHASIACSKYSIPMGYPQGPCGIIRMNLHRKWLGDVGNHGANSYPPWLLGSHPYRPPRYGPSHAGGSALGAAQATRTAWRTSGTMLKSFGYDVMYILPCGHVYAWQRV